MAENSVTPEEEYYNGKVLGLTYNQEGDQYTWDNFGPLQGPMCLCLLLSWIIVCLILIKGLESLGKAAYVITLSPYVVLTILLIYSTTLPGAGDGISYLFTPDWSKLGDVQVWSAAASQIMFSVSLGYGSQLVLASYNDFRNNTHRDALIIAVCNSATSIYAGFVVFAILGYIAYEQDKDIDDVSLYLVYL